MTSTKIKCYRHHNVKRSRLIKKETISIVSLVFNAICLDYDSNTFSSLSYGEARTDIIMKVNHQPY